MEKLISLSRLFLLGFGIVFLKKKYYVSHAEKAGLQDCRRLSWNRGDLEESVSRLG